MPGDDNFRDENLQRRFAQLRLEDQAKAGEFYGDLRLERRHGTRTRFFLWATSGLAVIIAAILISVRPQPAGRNTLSSEIPIMQWKSSTDFLLQTPGQEILSTIPKLGKWPAYSQPPGAGQKTRTDGTPIRKNVTKLFNEEHTS